MRRTTAAASAAITKATGETKVSDVLIIKKRSD